MMARYKLDTVGKDELGGMLQLPDFDFKGTVVYVITTVMVLLGGTADGEMAIDQPQKH